MDPKQQTDQPNNNAEQQQWEQSQLRKLNALCAAQRNRSDSAD